MDKIKDLFESTYYNEDGFMLTEKLITFGGKAYPQFGQVVILAGGGGSGKGFTLSNLLGIEGKIFDPDALKSLALKTPKFKKRVKDVTGHDLDSFNLRRPENVATLHTIIADEFGIDKKVNKTMLNSILASDSSRKPNLIFDVTLKSIKKLRDISTMVQEVGYKKENIHIVWVLNSIDVAVEQNKNRSRVVPEDILIQTHEGTALTMKKLFTDGKTLSSYMDGDFWISANLKMVDTSLATSGKQAHNPLTGKLTGGGHYVVKSNYFLMKKKGKQVKSISDFDKELLKKIQDYTPKIDVW